MKLGRKEKNRGISLTWIYVIIILKEFKGLEQIKVTISLIRVLRHIYVNISLNQVWMTLLALI